MSKKKGNTAMLLGCAGCLGILLIGGLGLGLAGAVGVGGFIAWGTASAPNPYEIEPIAAPFVEPEPTQPDPKPVVDTDTEGDTELDEDTEADTDVGSDTEIEPDTEPQEPTQASRPTPSPSPSPAPVVARPSPSPSPSPAPRATPAPFTPPPAAPAPSSESFVSLDGDGSVVLIGGGRRYTIPGNVPAGRYDIEVTFPGQEAVSVDRITVREGSDATIRCNARMGVCRPR